jgi:hypothetical protein
MLSNSVSELSNAGAPISGPNGFVSGNMQHPGAIAIDGSGNAWIANYYTTSITEMIGVAAPVVTPLSVGVKNNTLGTRP